MTQVMADPRKSWIFPDVRRIIMCSAFLKDALLYDQSVFSNTDEDCNPDYSM